MFEIPGHSGADVLRQDVSEVQFQVLKFEANTQDGTNTENKKVPGSKSRLYDDKV